MREQLSLIEEDNETYYSTYYSIRTKTAQTVSCILNEEKDIEIEGINLFESDIKSDHPIFIVLGGDKGKAEVTWETGLIGIGKVSKEPYDSGYLKRNYRIKIDMELLLDAPMTRHDFLHYANAYNVIGIGPITKWEPNQAISRIERNKAVTLVRAILDKYPLLEEKIRNIFDPDFMNAVIQENQYLIPQSYRYGEQIPLEELDEKEIQEQDYVELYEPELDRILEDLLMQQNPIISFKNFINIGKHVIFTGPPGTGKTTIAENVAKEAKRTNYVNGYTVTTATADWSTFETIGGYMPNAEGKLEFEEGVILKSIRENKWLIIDEFNRADIDKAFGQIFTVLSGKNVELPFKDATTKRNINIKSHRGLNSYYDQNTNIYWVGKNWRLIGTMNTFDKNSLFEMSFALMRRFAFVNIPIPSNQFLLEMINNSSLNEESKQFINNVISFSPKPLGPAIIREMISYLEITGDDGWADALCSSVIPQFEGLLMNQIETFFKELEPHLLDHQKDIVVGYLHDFFDLKVATNEDFSDELDK